MRNLRVMLLALLGFTLVACGGEATDGEIVDSVEQAADRCLCPAVVDPVCGVDGVTYDNACVARCAGMKIAYKGECRPTMCPMVYDPVCGVDGKTYGNGCEAGVAGVEIAHPGPCLSVKPGPSKLAAARDDTMCLTVWDPVCGVDGNTYGNDCEAYVAGVRVAHKGECLPYVELPQAADTAGDSDDRNSDRCNCPAWINPVCGVDGKTWDNACVAACEDVEVDYEGACKE